MNVDRPLLAIYRFEIQMFLNFWNLPVYPDQSNKQTHLLRNRTRKQLLPTLKILFNPQVERSLLHFIEIDQCEQNYFEKTLGTWCSSFGSVPVSLLKRYLWFYFFETPVAERILFFEKACMVNEGSCAVVEHKGNILSSSGKHLNNMRTNGSLGTKRLVFQEHGYNRNTILKQVLFQEMFVNKLELYPLAFQKRSLQPFFLSAVQLNQALVKKDKAQLNQVVLSFFFRKLFTRQEKKDLLVCMLVHIDCY